MDQVGSVGEVHVTEGSLRMSVTDEAGGLSIPRQAGAGEYRLNRGSLVRALYMTSVISATIGWLWLIASAVMQLL
jgi:hypothetical protein